jgi:lipopolysaccharide biosynthesis glycosyltransferase
MRAGEEPFVGWKGQPRTPAAGRGYWATPFTMFRYAVPELAGHKGFAIYLDADMLVLDDIAELWAYRKVSTWASCDSYKGLLADYVSVIDCSAFKHLRIKDLKEGKYTKFNIQEFTKPEPIIPDHWNRLDKYEEPTSLIHYTQMITQPWRPWADVLDYKPHPNSKAVEFWNKYEYYANN